MNVDIVTDVIEENIVTVDDQSVILEADDISNRTFNDPSQVDNTSSDKLFKCEICDFASSRTDIIKNHTEFFYNWCNYCFSSFNNQKKLKIFIVRNDMDWAQLVIMYWKGPSIRLY